MRYVPFFLLLLVFLRPSGICAYGLETPGDSDQTVEELLQRADDSYTIGNHTDALTHYQRVLGHYRAQGEDSLEVMLMLQIAEMYRAAEKFSIANEYLDMAQALNRQLGSLSIQARIYDYRVAVYYEEKKRDSSLHYARLERDMLRRLPEHPELKGRNEMLLGAIFSGRFQLDSAMHYLRQAERTYQKTPKLKRDLPNVYNNLANFFLRAEMPDSTLYYASQSVQLAKKHNIKAYLQMAHQMMELAYLKKDDYKNAHFHQSISDGYRDSILNASSMLDLEISERRFRMAEKEKENALLRAGRAEQEATIQVQQSRQRIYLTALIALFILLSGLVFYHLKTRRLTRNLRLKTLENQQQNYKLQEMIQVLEHQEKQLRENNSFKDKLMSIVAHDLRQPLASLHSSLELIEMGDVDPAQQKWMLSRLSERTKLTEKMVNNLLTWARGSMNHQQLDTRDVYVGEVFSTVFEQLKEQIEAKKLTVYIKASKSVYLHTDAEMLRTMVRNLLNNAIKFSQPGQNIYLDAMYAQDEIFISVVDEGVGMNGVQLEQLREGKRLQSLPGTYAEKGNGLGLLLIREFLERMGGRWEVKSKKGEGASFKLFFKCYREELSISPRNDIVFKDDALNFSFNSK